LKRKQQLGRGKVKKAITITGVEGIYDLSRRQSFLFLKLKLGDLDHIENLNTIVNKIKKTWSNYKIYKIYKLKKQQRNLTTIIKIQRWFRTWNRRFKIKKSLRIIQPVWKLKANNLIRIKVAVVVIQHAWKLSIRRLLLLLLLLLC
jgi:hypothetical protein